MFLEKSPGLPQTSHEGAVTQLPGFRPAQSELVGSTQTSNRSKPSPHSEVNEKCQWTAQKKVKRGTERHVLDEGERGRTGADLIAGAVQACLACSGVCCSRESNGEDGGDAHVRIDTCWMAIRS